jgi:hypothetical protein
MSEEGKWGVRRKVINKIIKKMERKKQYNNQSYKRRRKTECK